MSVTIESVQEAVDQPIIADLERVFEEFLALLPEAYRELARKDVYVAGGAIVNLVRGEVPVDYDFFIKTETTRNFLRSYFDTMNPPQVVANTLNAVTLRVGEDDKHAVQLVTRFFGPPERVFTSFDFEHCKSYYDFATGQLYYNREIILNKKLVYTGEKDVFTLNTMKRMIKFVKRGWNTDHESLINLHRAIQNQEHIDVPRARAAQTIGFYGSSWD